MTVPVIPGMRPFGAGLSAGAAANVTAYVGGTGAVVLFNADFADDIGDPNTNILFQNAFNFTGDSLDGYIGELNGLVAALTCTSMDLTR